MGLKEVLDSIQGVELRVLPSDYQLVVTLALYAILIAIYSIFIFKFYKFLGRRDILRLNLKQYNTTTHPGLKKFLVSIFFIIEYIIILPVVVIFWFIVLAIFLLLLSESQAVDQVVLIAAAIVAAIRLTAYFSEDLSKDLAKIFPFTVLAIFLLNPDFFVLSDVIGKIWDIPLLFRNVVVYMVFIIALEAVLRLVFLFIDLILSSQDSESS
ncbi:MAG: hypothetical protein ABIE22_00570 [archaeon]